MNLLQYTLKGFDSETYVQGVPQENINNNLNKNLNQVHNGLTSSVTQEKNQAACNSNSNSDKKYLKNVMKHSKSISSLVLASPNKLDGFDNYLISPIKEYKFKESAFTPLKNETLLLFTPSMKLEVPSESPFEKLEYFSSKKKERIIQGKCINFNNIDISPEISEHEVSVEETPVNYGKENKIRCTCTKTFCQKKYCACYASGKYCDDCECENCENKGMNINDSNNKRVISIICNCTKSNCTKKYCECFKNGKTCSSLCRCINCINCSPLPSIKKNPLKASKTNSTNSTELYSIEGTGIEIKNNKIYIIHRNINPSNSISDKEDESFAEDAYTPMKVIGKKRAPKIMHSTNVKTPGLKSQKNKRKNQKIFSNKKKFDL